MLCSCSFVSSLMHEGEVVANVGSRKLYSVEIESYIPKGMSPDDSLKLAQQFIRNWTIERLYEQVAEKELSKAAQDVSKELEDYRRSLLKYRYEQSYVNQRLDTTITDKQIGDYYDSHQAQLKLKAPILRARYVKVYKDSPNLQTIRKQLSVEDEDGMVATDSLLIMSTIRNTHYGGRWVEASVLAREFGVDYESLLNDMANGYIERKDAEGNDCIAYVYEIIKAGHRGPEEYYRDRIKDIILSARKQTLLLELEQDLLKTARTRGDNDTH